jgi:hypothetical protein
LQDAAIERAWLNSVGQNKTRGLLLNFGAVGNTKDYLPTKESMTKLNPNYHELIENKFGPLGDRLRKEVSLCLDTKSPANTIVCLTELENFSPYEVFFFACSFVMFAQEHYDQDFLNELMAHAFDFLMESITETEQLH